MYRELWGWRRCPHWAKSVDIFRLNELLVSGQSSPRAAAAAEPQARWPTQRGHKASTAALKQAGQPNRGTAAETEMQTTNIMSDCQNPPPPRVLLPLQFLQLTLMELPCLCHQKSSFATVTPTEPHFYPSVCAALCKVTAFIRIRQRSINSSVGILSLSFHTNTARPTSATVGMKLHSGLVATQKTLETAVWDSKYKKYLFDTL